VRYALSFNLSKHGYYVMLKCVPQPQFCPYIYARVWSDGTTACFEVLSFIPFDRAYSNRKQFCNQDVYNTRYNNRNTYVYAIFVWSRVPFIYVRNTTVQPPQSPGGCPEFERERPCRRGCAVHTHIYVCLYLHTLVVVPSRRLLTAATDKHG
jgi:hypothetical protein